ncbi:DUF2795 domain-containing protein [Nostoc sp. UCD121]|uniref:DUF2795 domain-containing protein n=1 Tax=unclassified Nostoc TaxID=2593658 RepID=UPI00162AC15D|nr:MULTISPECIES: DUF2795 domain-containing protein [unclassified Nostoc]MBC1225373.1 DUF2795 domain-containing protein [Nostoc sp. UCD120]MBC1280487.1 DUF2795 domain-containing protein [Nostoc sp. UCD121]MBC1298680.1 DUF2795 domain-containing protein [Nostoc sp. UCD122]MBD2512614.1 DUF2795 domain-containing protein [Desmonostoc muscorum FACHB-395]
MMEINLIQLEKNLTDLNYPLSKHDLIKYAEEKGIDEKILRALKRLPSKEYKTLLDISNSLGTSE